MIITTISAKEVNERLNRGDKVMFVDTRPREEFTSEGTTLPGAIHIPANEAEEHIRDVNRDRLVVTYGAGADDMGSVKVAEVLGEHGFEDVHPLAGGMRAWREIDLPVEPR